MLNNAGSGALLLKVDESRLALGRGLAKRIMVRQAS
jgi:Fe2+ transport system protein FeoA